MTVGSKMVVTNGGSSAEAADWVAPFIAALWHRLDEGAIRWLVLRNHDRLDRVGHDIDLIVHPADASKVEPAVRDAIRARGLFLLRVRRGFEHHTFDVADTELRGRLLLHVDVQHKVTYRGRTLIDAEDLFADRRRADNGIWTLSPGMEAYALLLHSALHKGALKDAYRERLAAIELAAPGELLRIATERLGRKVGGRLAAVRSEPELLALRPALARALDNRYPANRVRRPWFALRSGASMSVLRIKPRGVFVVFLGPDGSGKSTTTDLLKNILTDPSGVVPVHRVYLGSGRPFLPTRKLARRLNGPKLQAKNAMVRDVQPRRLRGALHVMVDEIARYWAHVWPHLSPHGIVLADRYAYDVLRVNNRTVRSRWFRRIATTAIPTPDITFFLEGDPEVIAARKQELTVAETMRQQAAYRDVEDFIPTYRALDLTVRDEAKLRGVALQILDVFAERNGGTPRNATEVSGGTQPDASVGRPDPR